MKFGLLVIAALLLSAIGAHALLQDPGYVVVNFRGYLIEMSVPVLIGLVASLLIGVWLLRKIIRAPRRMGEAAARYRNNRAGDRLTRGMIEIAEGNFTKGERLLARTAHNSNAPLLNYLQAARAAHLQGQTERRDTWLKQAYEHTPEAASAVLLTQAELQLDEGQYEQALATLRRLAEKAPNHSRALTLLGRVYYRLADWDQLADLLPSLRKHARLDPEALKQWSHRVYREKMNHAADGDAVNEVWQAVNRADRRSVELRIAYFENLLRTDMHEQAEKELAQDIKKSWNGELVRLYGLARGADPARQLKKAESWLKAHGEDASLLLAAARLCVRAELWGKARSYLETVIALRPTPDAYHEYGQLMNQMGDNESAAEAFRDGLNLAADEFGNGVPRLEARQEPPRITHENGDQA